MIAGTTPNIGNGPKPGLVGVDANRDDLAGVGVELVGVDGVVCVVSLVSLAGVDENRDELELAGVGIKLGSFLASSLVRDTAADG